MTSGNATQVTKHHVIHGEASASLNNKRYTHDKKSQGVLVSVVGHEKTVTDMHRQYCHQHCNGVDECRGASQKTQRQCKAAKKLGAASEQGHQITGLKSNAGKPLPGTVQPIPAKPAKQFLSPMGGENQADRHPKDQGGNAGIGRRVIDPWVTEAECPAYEHTLLSPKIATKMGNVV